MPPPGGSAAFLPEQRVIATAPAEPERWLNFAVIAFGIVVAVFAGLFALGVMLESSLSSSAGPREALKASARMLLAPPCEGLGTDPAMRLEVGCRSTA